MINNISKFILVFGASLLISLQSSAQDPAFSQFYANPIYLNPAFTGASAHGGPRMALNYRDQWPGIGRTFITTSASFDAPVDAVNGGLGFIVLNDRSGDGNIQLNSLSALYSYHLQVNRGFALKAGFEASFRMLDLDWSQLTFGDMIDQKYGFIYPTQEDIANNPSSVAHIDFSSGVIGYTQNLFFGMAFHHMTQPEQGFISESQLPSKFTAHMGGNFPLSKYKNNVTTISPNFLYQKQQDFQQFNYGVYIYRGPIVGGLWARNSLENFDSFILMFGVIQETFKFGYSYDITVSNLKNSNTMGAHEISFTYFMPRQSRSKSFNTISCPQF